MLKNIYKINNIIIKRKYKFNKIKKNSFSEKVMRKTKAILTSNAIKLPNESNKIEKNEKIQILPNLLVTSENIFNEPENSIFNFFIF